jgi:hypothetical protein
MELEFPILKKIPRMGIGIRIEKLTISIRFNLRDFENKFFYFSKNFIYMSARAHRLHELNTQAKEAKNHTIFLEFYSLPKNAKKF